MKLEKGCTRWVIVTRRYALKFPACYSWSHFLQGLLCNLQERNVATLHNEERILYPVFCLWGGWLNVYPRVSILTELEFENVDIRRFCPTKDGEYPIEGVIHNIPVENKHSSFGWYQERVVAIDYGS